MATEKRLIDEFMHEVISKFIELCRGNDYNKLTLLRIGETIERVYEKYRTLPTVEAVEVVHGRWDTEKCNHKPHRIKNPEKWVIYKCSVCGYSNGRKQSNYCPNCGADMREREDDGLL